MCADFVLMEKSLSRNYCILRCVLIGLMLKCDSSALRQAFQLKIELSPCNKGADGFHLVCWCDIWSPSNIGCLMDWFAPCWLNFSRNWRWLILDTFCKFARLDFQLLSHLSASQAQLERGLRQERFNLTRKKNKWRHLEDYSWHWCRGRWLSIMCDPEQMTHWSYFCSREGGQDDD